MIENWEESIVFEEEFRKFVKLADATPKIKKALEYIISAGGKRVRPIIVLLSGKMCNGNYERLINLAIAVELVHTASLVHDDVIDQAEMRRKNPALHKKYDTALAIVLGDWLISKSIELTSIYGEEVIKECAKVGMMMSEGEILDFYSVRENFDEKNYFECIEKKTASLFAYSAKTACKIVSGDKVMMENLYNYGYNLGMAYQLVDDLLEYKDAIKDKKSEFESLTLPYIYSKKFGEKVAIEKTMKLISDFVKKSFDALRYFPECKEKEKLKEVVKYMTRDMLKQSGLFLELSE